MDTTFNTSSRALALHSLVTVGSHHPSKLVLLAVHWTGSNGLKRDQISASLNMWVHTESVSTSLLNHRERYRVYTFPLKKCLWQRKVKPWHIYQKGSRNDRDKEVTTDLVCRRKNGTEVQKGHQRPEWVVGATCLFHRTVLHRVIKISQKIFHHAFNKVEPTESKFWQSIQSIMMSQMHKALRFFIDRVILTSINRKLEVRFINFHGCEQKKVTWRC